MRIRFALILALSIATLAAAAAISRPAAAAAPPARSARPSSVPLDYVVTPNGYFHPSCIVALGPDEMLGRDLVVRGNDGAGRRAIPACAYPRFTASGRPIAPDAFTRRPDMADAGSEDAGSADEAGATDGGPDDAGLDGAPPPQVPYDGWLVYYASEQNAPLPPALTLTGKWVVPPSPTTGAVPGGDPVTIFFFTGINFPDLILQPVLGYGAAPTLGSGWTIASWSCCVSGLEALSTQIEVNPGDLIKGITAGTDCGATTCATWTISTTDLTTGQSTALKTTEPDQPIYITPAVLETYGVNECDMLPPGGEETFFDTTLTSGSAGDAGDDGGALSLPYAAHSIQFPGAPSCGYTGLSLGGSYTIFYGNTSAAGSTITSLGATPSSALAGANVLLEATVTASATGAAMAGNVEFYQGATMIGVVDLAATTDGVGHAMATAALSTSPLPGGAYAFTATYGGSGGYQPSTSPAATINLEGWATSTTLDVTPSSPAEASSVQLVATVTSSVPASLPSASGTVQFYSGTALLGSAPLTSASDGGAPAVIATLDVPSLSVGGESFVASYGGDSYNAPSSSAPSIVTVTSTLDVTPSAPTAPPRGTVSFATSAGVPPVTWSLITNASGATIDPASGVYVAGPAPGVSDVLLVTDSSGGSATTTVTVGPGVSIAPASPSLAAGGTITFAASGGSGVGYSWSLTASPSGGSVAAATGVYVAGPHAGVTDVVTVSDSLGNVAGASVAVTAANVAADGGTSADAGAGAGADTGGGEGCSCEIAGDGGSGGSRGAGEIAALALGFVGVWRRRRTPCA